MTLAVVIHCGHCGHIVDQPDPVSGLKLYCTRSHQNKARQHKRDVEAFKASERPCAACGEPHRRGLLFGSLDICRGCRLAAYGTCWRKKPLDDKPTSRGKARPYRCGLCDAWHVTCAKTVPSPLLELRLAGLKRLIRSTGFDIGAHTRAEIDAALHIREAPERQPVTQTTNEGNPQ